MKSIETVEKQLKDYNRFLTSGGLCFGHDMLLDLIKPYAIDMELSADYETNCDNSYNWNCGLIFDLTEYLYKGMRYTTISFLLSADTRGLYTDKITLKNMTIKKFKNLLDMWKLSCTLHINGLLVHIVTDLNHEDGSCMVMVSKDNQILYRQRSWLGGLDTTLNTTEEVQQALVKFIKTVTPDNMPYEMTPELYGILKQHIE